MGLADPPFDNSSVSTPTLVITRLAPGWFAGKGVTPSAEQIRDHLSQIMDTAGHTIPSSVNDETMLILQTLQG